MRTLVCPGCKDEENWLELKAVVYQWNRLIWSICKVPELPTVKKTKAPPSRNAQPSGRENSAKKQNRVKGIISGEVLRGGK